MNHRTHGKTAGTNQRMSTWLRASAGERTREKRQKAARAGPAAPLNTETSTQGYRAETLVPAKVLATEEGCCVPFNPSLENAYYVVTQGPTRDSTGFSFDENGAFTVEWWQDMSTFGQYPRAFSIGTYPNTVFGVSLEQGSLYVWMNNNFYPQGVQSIYYSDTVGTLAHFAVVRQTSGLMSVYINGENRGEFNNGVEIPVSSANLTIRNESNPSCASQLYGDLPSFHWVNGTALYTEPFVGNLPPLRFQPTPDTVLLINDFPTSAPATFNGYTVTRFDSVPFEECVGGD
jgi:hypothetical protein